MINLMFMILNKADFDKNMEVINDSSSSHWGLSIYIIKSKVILT